MTNKTFRIYTVTIAAGDSVPIHASGAYVVALSATGSFALAFDGGPFTPFLAGLKVQLAHSETFKTVRIKDTSGNPNTIMLGLGFGDLTDARLNLSGAITIAGSQNIATVADVALAAGVATQIVAANVARRAVVVKNLAGNLQTMRIGDAVAGAARGLELAPGETISIDSGAAVYGYNPGGAAESVSVMEVRD